nr:laccase domain-containing protein [Brevibacterium sp. JSBI002]
MLRSRFVIPGGRTAHIAFTDRHGGYSSGDFSSFNLARHVGDDDELVAANRAALAQVIGLSGERLSFVSQVHGTDVHIIDDEAQLRHTPVEADAQLTTVPGLGLAIMVADCTPVMLADADAGVIAAVHAGAREWPQESSAERWLRCTTPVHGTSTRSSVPRCVRAAMKSQPS